MTNKCVFAVFNEFFIDLKRFYEVNYEKHPSKVELSGKKKFLRAI
jgi:hypothetical protein